MDDTPAIRKHMLTRRIWIALVILYGAGLHAVVGLALIKTDLADRTIRKLSQMASPPPPAAPPAPPPLPAPPAPPPEPAVVEALPPPPRNYQKELAAILDRDLFKYPLYTQFALMNLVPADPVFFVGDSMVRGLDVAALTPAAVNLGLSGDNTAGTLYRIRLYPDVIPRFQTAGLLVIAVGVNNLGLGAPADPLIANHIKRMLASRPKEQRLVLNAIFPVDQTIKPAELAGYNRRIETVNRKLQSICATFTNCTFLNAGMRMRDGNGNLAKQYHRKNDAFHLSPQAYSVWIEELRAILPDLAATPLSSPQPGEASPPVAAEAEPALPR